MNYNKLLGLIPMIADRALCALTHPLPQWKTGTWSAIGVSIIVENHFRNAMEHADDRFDS